MIKKVLLFALFFCTTSLTFAGAWVQEKGQGLDILAVRRYESNQFWDSNGNQQSSPVYKKWEISNYIEYGLGDKFTIGFYASALQSHTNAAGTQTGDYDNMLFGRYLVWTGNSKVLSLQAFVDALGSGVQFNIPASNSHLNTGQSVLFGASGQNTRKTVSWFFGSLVGIVERYNAGNQAQVNFEGGLKFDSDQFWLLMQSFNTMSLDHIANPTGPHYNLYTLSGSAVYWLTKTLGLQVGMSQDVGGKNVGKGTSPFLATWFKF
ncbi:MAG TPA: hypothetical protein VHM20_04805 [Gammaproteobacteria bacterium]|jgi:hypothetical protein|nr:hypothetical protein [Gammaproteobacteria bacterium]